MGIDTSIYNNIKPAQIENPLNYLLQAQQLQQGQNTNSLFPMQQQEMQLKLLQAQRMNELVTNVLARRNGQQSAPQGAQEQGGNALAMGPQGSGNALSPQGSNPSGIPTNDGTGYSLGDLADLATVGYGPAAEMLKVKQAAMQGSNFEPGKTYNVGGHVFTVPLLDKGMQMGANGVEAIPGYSATNAAIQGQQAGATESAKPLPLGYVGQDGRPIGGTVGQYLGQPAQGAQPAPQGGGSAQGPQGLDVSKLSPQQVAGLARTDPTAFANGTKDFQQTSTSSYTPPTVGIDGTPVPPQAQAILSQVAASRDPAQLQKLVQGTMQHISQVMPAGQQQQAALQNVQSEAQKIQQSWATQQAQPAQSNGMPVLQSATEAGQAAASVDLQKQQAMDQLKLQNAPQLDYASSASKALQAKGEAIGTELTDVQNMVQRMGAMRDAMTQFKAGGGMETKMAVAKVFQGVGAPDSVVNDIAGGNLAAAQTFEKHATTEALQAMRLALKSEDGKGSPGNRVAMQQFFLTNPKVDTDPNATEKLFNFYTGQHDQLLNKSDMFNKFVSDKAKVKDPAVFDNEYAHYQIDHGNVNPKIVQGAAKGTAPAASVTPANIQSLLDKYK